MRVTIKPFQQVELNPAKQVLQATPYEVGLILQARPPVCKRQVCIVCRAQETVSPPGRQFNPLLMGAVEALFRFPPFFNAAAKNARRMIVKRAEALGLDWEGAMRGMQAQDWEARLKAVTNPAVTYPDYYTQPFHAYGKGNLCWEAALEVTMAAKSVHAAVMDPAGREMDPEGDAKLRASYSARLLQCLSDLGVDPGNIRTITDLGCATGLSTLELMRAFPSADRVTGVDLSPHLIAVGRYEQELRQLHAQPVPTFCIHAANGGVPEGALTLLHGAAERTPLPAGSQDLVSLCLVCHELPQGATRNIMREAFRVLRPGGVMAVMEMNPQSATFQRIFGNPFAYTAFKSTEPWLQEYITLDMPGALRDAGFAAVVTREATPRHKTVVALKHGW
ncbi:hypothetical protein VOLCADRAFT_90465 [Volvox carteri f. nagariensis]|uniref:Methyltransferase type 11 domain-containing protein n=1 Tax=Volvox carteri f. nagariensis TaxID=3068 RepID=D8TUG1_VOLCA|nr:uncharacterized protein VOLCADRAFT_90465 [Volvox carteri f. nagariensis]EFJ48819.1 hypothetical protein VOLCADRAFT_90465 [Volvox carteri f. nagariensis]|eukprot:XP_002950151.1 hypothetical protein VOLCADRAFT_90465 [Volvox carteri f. nagariensis]